jgi:ArsR family transcriptional regulator
MYNLQLPGGEFELVVIHQVLHYAEDPKSVIEESARILKPGGQLVVVDFARHDQSFLQSEHQHRWLGFGDGEVSGWLEAAGMRVEPAQRLVGDPLTVLVWAATERAGGRKEKAA